MRRVPEHELGRDGDERQLRRQLLEQRQAVDVRDAAHQRQLLHGGKRTRR